MLTIRTIRDCCQDCCTETLVRRLSFKTQFKIEFLGPFNGPKKSLKKSLHVVFYKIWNQPKIVIIVFNVLWELVYFRVLICAWHDFCWLIALQGSRPQLEEVWEEEDGLDKDQFNPRTFFKIHGKCTYILTVILMLHVLRIINNIVLHCCFTLIFKSWNWLFSQSMNTKIFA